MQLGSYQKANEVNEMEKEFLGGVRLSDFTEQDTVTVSRYVVEDTEHFFERIGQVIGQEVGEDSFGKTEFDEENRHFKTHTPNWFSPNQHCSIAQWACFFILRALKISYEH